MSRPSVQARTAVAVVASASYQVFRATLRAGEGGLDRPSPPWPTQSAAARSGAARTELVPVSRRHLAGVRAALGID